MASKSGRLGYLLGYLLAGCQSIIANLWAITPTEIDIFARELLTEQQNSVSKISTKWLGAWTLSNQTSVMIALANQ